MAQIFNSNTICNPTHSTGKISQHSAVLIFSQLENHRDRTMSSFIRLNQGCTTFSLCQNILYALTAAFVKLFFYEFRFQAL